MSYPFSSIPVQSNGGYYSFFADDNEPYRKVAQVMVDCCTSDYNAVTVDPTGYDENFVRDYWPKVVEQGVYSELFRHYSDDFNRESIGTTPNMFMGTSDNAVLDPSTYNFVGPFTIANNKAVKSASSQNVGLHGIVYSLSDTIHPVGTGNEMYRFVSAHIDIKQNSSPFDVGFVFGTSGSSTGLGLRGTLNVSGDTLSMSLHRNNVLQTQTVTPFSPVGSYHVVIQDDWERTGSFSIRKDGVLSSISFVSSGVTNGAGVGVYSTDPSGFSTIDNLAVFSKYSP